MLGRVTSSWTNSIVLFPLYFYYRNIFPCLEMDAAPVNIEGPLGGEGRGALVAQVGLDLQVDTPYVSCHLGS